MSDPAAPDPIDQAYVRAAAILDDEDARAARRARVLAAVAGSRPAAAVTSPHRSGWRPDRRLGGWLAAASVAGLSLFVATQLYRPPPPPSALAPPRLQLPAPAPSTPAAVATPGLGKPPPPPEVHMISPPPPPPPPPPELMAPSAPIPQPNLTSISPVPADKATRGYTLFSGRAPSPAASTPAARLRAAAAAGRTDEIEALLAGGVEVDAPDADGETALMKSIEAGRPAAAALLRRHGASLDRRNRAGESARDMAAAKGDEALNQAIDEGPP